MTARRWAGCRVLGGLAALAVAFVPGGIAGAWAAGHDVALRIKHQAFLPDVLIIPAGQAVTIQVTNEDVLPAEFESGDLNREKVIPGGTTIPVYIGKLTPGMYKFFNDFHPRSTGKLIVQASPTASGAGK